jgi:hypothetical protein
MISIWRIKKGGFMLKRIFRRKNFHGLFDGHFIEVKKLYVLEFDMVPSLSFIGDVDASAVFDHIKSVLGDEVLTVYQHAFYNHDENEMQFNNTIFLMTNNRLIELGVNYCQVLHMPTQHAWARDLIGQLSKFRIVQPGPVIGFSRQTVSN